MAILFLIIFFLCNIPSYSKEEQADSEIYMNSGMQDCLKDINVEEKIMTYKCEYQNDDTLESMEFIYNDDSKEYTKIKSYYQVNNLPNDGSPGYAKEIKGYEEIVSKLQKNTTLNITWKIENNTLYESTEIELNKVDNNFLTYIEQVEDKYDITESVENIFYLLKNEVYSNGKIDNEKITNFITENNCKVTE